MKMKTIGMIALALMLMINISFAATPDYMKTDGFEGQDPTAEDGIDDVTTMIGKVISIVQYAAVGIAVLFASITGVQFMGARDPVAKRSLGDRLKYILIGLAIVVLSFPIVKLVL